MKPGIRVVQLSAAWAVPGLAAVWFWMGFEAAVGFASGFCVAGASVLSIALLGHLLAARNATPKAVASSTGLVWMVKLPIFALLIAGVCQMGIQAIQGFVPGLALVYCVLLLWTAASARKKD